MSPVLEVLATRFRTGRAGRRAAATRDVLIPFNDLLKKAGCLHGTLRHEAIMELETLEAENVLVLERHSRDRTAILKVRLPLAKADSFFGWLGQTHPEVERRELAVLFLQAEASRVPAQFESGWMEFCRGMADAAESGASVKPFDRGRPEQTRLILDSLPRILAWPGESLVRFASAVLFGDSKRLETLRPRIESCLTRICRKTPATLADFGILENERSFLLHGPLRLTFPDGELNAGLLQKPVRLGVSDLRRARLDPGTRRCLTVENAAMLHELAKTPENLLLVSSGSEGGYANSAVIEFLEMLPADIELWHFGDSDPKGFDVLRDMRQRSGRKIVSLHMAYRPTSHSPPLTIEDVKTIDRLITSDFLVESEKRELATMREEQTKGDFEQEHLGPPGSMWPFY